MTWYKQGELTVLWGLDWVLGGCCQDKSEHVQSWIARVLWYMC
jgi:hypothetical protein